MTGNPEAGLPEHTQTFLEMAFRTDRQKALAHPSGVGLNVGACRDRIEIQVAIREGIVREVAYRLEGCLNTNACANAVAEMVEGHTVAAAWALKPEMVAEFLQSLPPDHFHCAELAVGAFYKALADYQQQGGQDWKTAYRAPG
ncbi:MAG: iron-sulfur cluster assembly scaffold protein [Desulfobacterales bacterium]|nr:iron-sulfur cluster assembly scaffold protein [Desulfobacterales bacterium]MDJ0991801.1 iron-sulfur cluster assembly scaffold protein [Desulfobacterales bacterium]